MSVPCRAHPAPATQDSLPPHGDELVHGDGAGALPAGSTEERPLPVEGAAAGLRGEGCQTLGTRPWHPARGPLQCSQRIPLWEDADSRSREVTQASPAVPRDVAKGSGLLGQGQSAMPTGRSPTLETKQLPSTHGWDDDGVHQSTVNATVGTPQGHGREQAAAPRVAHLPRVTHVPQERRLKSAL